MKITKHEHATLVVESAGDTIVVDPGIFLSATDFLGITAVIVTHEHGDHWTSDHLRRILDANPEARLLGPAGVAAAASEFPVEVVAPGDVVTVGETELEFFGGQHAVIHSSIPMIDNVGVLIAGELYYAGDSYAVPGRPVGTLAAPIGAPWLKIGDAMDFVLEVAPRRAFYTHDMTLSVAGKRMGVERLTWATEQGGGTFTPLEPGESLDI